MFKKIILLSLLAGYCFADNTALYGTPDNPQIDGVTYDLHKPYIEPNQGDAKTAVKSSDDTQNKTSNNIPSTDTPNLNSKNIVKQQSNIKSDEWINNPKIERMLKQAASEGKLDYVLGETKKANVPAAVATVPMAESNYNKKAVSPKGAAGAWQLMPGTANDYGISTEDRFNLEHSTKAAIELLKDLHSQFGDWLLAFAAYNCGAQCVTNALRKNPSATDIDELSLPKETKAYVHHIVQINQVLSGLDHAN